MPAKISKHSHSSRKIISVSQKRQITIPLKFFTELGLESEVECFIQEDALVIRPIRTHQDEFSVEILKDLVSQGFSGDELIRQFEVESKNIHNAARSLIDDAERIARGEMTSASFDDVFGKEG